MADLQSSGRMASGLPTTGQPNSQRWFSASSSILHALHGLFRKHLSIKILGGSLQDDGDSSVLDRADDRLSAPRRVVLRLGAQ